MSPISAALIPLGITTVIALLIMVGVWLRQRTTGP